MTDYTQGTGNSGTMMIRDNGNGSDGWVEFWLRANSSTFNYQLPWGYTINGSDVANNSQHFRFETGGNWQRLGSFYVNSSQWVTFKLGASGTNSLGGPTNFTVYIDRARVPDPPSIYAVNTVTSNSANVGWNDGWNGGAAIGDHQVGYGTDPWNVQYLSALTGTQTFTTIGGLASGTTYYFWARSWNAKGWSNWGNRAQATTLRVPDAPTVPTASNVQPTSIHVDWSPNYDGGSGIWVYEVAWSWDTAASGAYVGTNVSTDEADITGLTPGTVYYFWVRAGNDVGWGPYAGPSAGVRTTAGARIKVGSEYKFAVPYVKVGGTWRLAQPYVRDAGNWKRTI